MRIHTTVFKEIIYKPSEKKEADKRVKTYLHNGYTIEAPEDYSSGDDDFPLCVQVMTSKSHEVRE